MAYLTDFAPSPAGALISRPDVDRHIDAMLAVPDAMQKNALALFNATLRLYWGGAATETTQPQPSDYHQAPAPDFETEPLRVQGKPVHVRCTNLTPFTQVYSLEADVRRDPKSDICLVMANSGHTSELLVPQVHALLPWHNVHVIHVIDPHFVPTKHGEFGMEENVEAVPLVIGSSDFRNIGTLMGGSQGGRVAMEAAILMANHPDSSNGRQPKNLVLLGLPVSPSANYMYWVAGRETNPIFSTVPARALDGKAYPGAGRPIITGKMQQTLLRLLSSETVLEPDKPARLQSLTRKLIQHTLREIYYHNTLGNEGVLMHRGLKLRPEAVTSEVLEIAANADKVVPHNKDALKKLFPQTVTKMITGGHYHLFSGPGVAKELIPAVHNFIAPRLH